jgi:integrase
MMNNDLTCHYWCFDKLKVFNMKDQQIPVSAIDELLEKLLSEGKEQVHDICFLMLNSGLRIAEILDVKFSDIDFTTGILGLKVAKERSNNEKTCVVQLSDKAIKILAKIRNKHPKDKYVFQSRKSNNQVNKEPNSISRQTVVNTIKQINLHAEYKLSLNSFRQAYATSYLRDQLSMGTIIDVKHALKHTTVNMTSQYIKDK